MNTDMEPKQYKLGDAIRQHYHTPPLESDLANAVNRRIFEQPVASYAAADRWIFRIGIVILLVIVVYGLILLGTSQIYMVLLFALIVVMMGWIARREFEVLKKVATNTLS